jgi:RAD54-like protein 2
LTNDKLNESTLKALRDEEERIRRLNAQQLPENVQRLDLLSSTIESIELELKNKKQQKQLLEQKPSIPFKNVNNTNAEDANELIANDSAEIVDLSSSTNELNKSSDQSVYIIDDDENEEHNENNNSPKTKNVLNLFPETHRSKKIKLNSLNSSHIEEIDLEELAVDNKYKFSVKQIASSNKLKINSEDDDDDCRIISDSERIEDEMTRMRRNVRGIHMNDEMNRVDAEGRVLVNVNHPIEDADIYLLPYLARNVKPHQIGGIRFLYDNIVESLERVKDNSSGFGCILAHAMGLGKTLQVISFIEVFLRTCTSCKRILCIVPINTIQNWLSEFNYWLPENGQQRIDTDTIINYCRPFKVFTINDYAKTFKQRSDIISKCLL